MNKYKFTQKFAARIGDGSQREISFLANDGKPMADGYTIDLDTLTVRDPDTDDQVRVADLQRGETKNYVGLFADHRWSVYDKIGEVRQLWTDEEGLHATAKIAQTDNGDNIMALAKDDMLDTWSITVGYTEIPDDGNVIHNAELLEISAVWLGNDASTRLHSVNIRKDIEMSETNNIETTALDKLTNAVEKLNEKLDAKTESNSRESVAVNAMAEAKKVNKVEQVEVKSNSAWLDSKEALKAYRNALVAHKNDHNMRAVTADFTAAAKANGVTGDAILPTDIANVFFKAWQDAGGILETFQQLPVVAANVYAMKADGESGRAKGHKKGETKDAQELTLVRRQLSAKIIYKLLPLDMIDIVNDTTGELLLIRAQELASRVVDEIARGAIVGDGREAPESSNPDRRVFDGANGLWSMKHDLDASTSDEFANTVATKIDAADVTDLSMYEKVRKALAKVKSRRVNGRDMGKVVVLPEGGIEAIYDSKNANSTPIITPGVRLDAIFDNVTFIEADWMTDSGYEMIAYAKQGYVLAGQRDAVVRTDYDIYKNQDLMINERAVSGSLQGYHAAAGIATA